MTGIAGCSKRIGLAFGAAGLDPMLLLGIDGGATTTRALIGTDAGGILAIGTGGPSNHLYGDAAKRRLRGALQQSISDAVRQCGLKEPSVGCAWLGMTGLREGSQFPALIEATVRGILDIADVHVSGDMETAHAGATALKPGILVYSGTGSNAFGVDAHGGTARCGGWGYLIDDEGGGYQVGRAALKAVYRASDGRAPATALTDTVLAHFGASTLKELTEVIYKDDGLDRPSIAALSRLVSVAAERGDDVSRDILATAGNELAQLAATVAAKLGRLPEPPVIYAAGGVFRAGPPLRSEFARMVAERVPGATILPPRFPPIVGAYLLALNAARIPVDAQLLARVEESLASLENAEL